MDLQYDGSLTDLLMNDTDLYDDTIQSNPTVLVPVQNEVVPRLRKSQRTKNFSVEEDKLIVSACLIRAKMQLLGMNNKVVHSDKEYCNT